MPPTSLLDPRLGFRRENVITDTRNVVLFAAEDSFYVGGISVDVNTEVRRQMVLRQYGFTGYRTGVAQSQTYTIEFERNFHSGFVRENITSLWIINQELEMYVALKCCVFAITVT